MLAGSEALAPFPDWAPLLGLTPEPLEPAVPDVDDFDAGVLDAGVLGGGELSGGEVGGGLDAAERPLAGCDGDTLILGPAVWAVLAGVGLGLVQGVPVAVAVSLRFALLLAAAEADVLGLFVGVLVPVELAAALPAGLTLPLGLALPPAAGLLVVLRLAGLAAAGGEGTLGVTDLLALAGGDDEVVGGHTVACGLLGPMAVPPWLIPPDDVPNGWPDPVAPCGPLVLGDVSPADWPSWTRASRAGGIASARPTANRAQAIARVGLSSASRQSRG